MFGRGFALFSPAYYLRCYVLFCSVVTLISIHLNGGYIEYSFITLGYLEYLFINIGYNIEYLLIIIGYLEYLFIN